MTIIKSEDTVFFDVDGTLIVGPDEDTAGPIFKVKDTVTKGYVTVRAHSAMIRLLREARQRGSHITVWSRGGWEWARNVVMALDIVDEVDHVMSKPLAYFDDVDVKEWLPYRVYLKPGTRYKSEIT